MVWTFGASKSVKMAGIRCMGRHRKTWGECVKDDMKLLGLQPEWDQLRDFIPWANV